MGYLTSVEECRNAAMSQLRGALAASDKWLAVVVTVEDGRLLLRRTTCDFPLADWPGAVELLRADLARETIPSVDPLPAGTLPPLSLTAPRGGAAGVSDAETSDLPGVGPSSGLSPALQEGVYADHHISG